MENHNGYRKKGLPRLGSIAGKPAGPERDACPLNPSGEHDAREKLRSQPACRLPRHCGQPPATFPISRKKPRNSTAATTPSTMR